MADGLDAPAVAATVGYLHDSQGLRRRSLLRPAVEPFPGRLTDQEFVELLKRPFCVGPAPARSSIIWNIATSGSSPISGTSFASPRSRSSVSTSPVRGNVPDAEGMASGSRNDTRSRIRQNAGRQPFTRILANAATGKVFPPSPMERRDEPGGRSRFQNLFRKAPEVGPASRAGPVVEAPLGSRGLLPEQILSTAKSTRGRRSGTGRRRRRSTIDRRGGTSSTTGSLQQYGHCLHRVVVDGTAAVRDIRPCRRHGA